MNDIITTHPTGLPDVIEEGGEVRVLDLTLAEKLGFERPRKVRDLIKRHRDALEGIGSLPHRGANPGPKGGRPGTAFYLNEAQAHFITAKAGTKLADIELARVAQVFTEYRRGNLIAKDAETQATLDEIEAKRQRAHAFYLEEREARDTALRFLRRR
ncbi:hypothetical protein [Magnetospirillum fulvum]|uniref:Phage protein n=1 Tax=Magnetospirillum fulvum MGU-K5 TaxID=1316936 RepID=S9TSY3_MAGFU|nr:hypothetical protein [Magnetospirillum fulvum]EPY01630.1 hypothetical protein K678_09958 [Magnetospirillum fulvum MGU-K5]